jgi:PqqD family protein of HPr-rel-A system
MAETFSDSDAPRPAPGVEAIELDDELVLFDPSTGALHALDPLASLIWRCLDGSTTVAELVADLSEGFATDEATLRHDVDGLLAVLVAIRVIETEAHPTSPPDAPELPDVPRILTNPPDP